MKTKQSPKSQAKAPQKQAPKKTAQPAPKKK